MRHLFLVILLPVLFVSLVKGQTGNTASEELRTTTVQYTIAKDDSLQIFAVLDSFIVNFRRPLNTYVGRHLKTYHFPHVRIASGQVSVIPSVDSLPAAYWEVRMPREWEYSEWVSRKIVQASPVKVHLVTVFRRFRKDNSVIADENSLYILDKVNGQWGVRARSSYAR